MLNINDENIQYDVNDLDQNAYMVLSSDHAQCRVDMPVLKFGEATTTVDIDLEVRPRPMRARCNAVSGIQVWG